MPFKQLNEHDLIVLSLSMRDKIKHLKHFINLVSLEQELNFIISQIYRIGEREQISLTLLDYFIKRGYLLKLIN